MRKQKEEAEKYTELQSQRKDLQRRLYLLRLFAVEKEVSSLQGRCDEARESADAERTKHAEVEEAVKSNEKEKARLSRKVIELERKTASLQQQIEGKSPEAIRLQEEISHAERRKKMSEKSLEKVVDLNERGEAQLAALREELDDVEQAVARLENENAEVDERGELSFGTKQRAEYASLKSQAGALTAPLAEKVRIQLFETRPRVIRGADYGVRTRRRRRHSCHCLYCDSAGC